MNIEEKIDIVKDFCNIKILYGRELCLLEEQLISYQSAIESLLTAYEKEKGENVKLRLQDIPLIEGELKAYKDRVNELKQELEKEKEKNKKVLDFINDKNNYFEDGENWQNILKIKDILEE